MNIHKILDDTISPLQESRPSPEQVIGREIKKEEEQMRSKWLEFIITKRTIHDLKQVESDLSGEAKIALHSSGIINALGIKKLIEAETLNKVLDYLHNGIYERERN